jgi:biotin carboxyl carrier protein
MDFRYQPDIAVRVERKGDHYVVTLGDHAIEVQVHRAGAGELTFTANGKQYQAYLAVDGSRRYVAFDATVHTVTRADSRRPRQAAENGEDNLTVNMPGQIVKVLVAEGETVKRGQPLILLEAMKMEIRINAPRDGHVIRVLCQPGQVIERGQRLLELSSK